MLKTKMIERKKFMIQKRNGKYPYKKWKRSINIIFLTILFAKNNLQAHRIVTSNKVFLENECRIHWD